MRTRALANAQRWVDAEVAAKALAPDSPLIGAESWVSGPYALVSWLSASIQTLEALDHGQDPLAQVTTHANADGTIAARVLPIHPYERLLFNGITADVWMQPGVTAENLRENTAGFYREKNPIGSVTLVLGAGNVSSIVPLDILDRRSAGGPG